MQTHGLKEHVRPDFSGMNDVIDEPEGALQSHKWSGDVPPRFSDVNEVIIEAEGEASDDTPLSQIPSADKVSLKDLFKNVSLCAV